MAKLVLGKDPLNSIVADYNSRFKTSANADLASYVTHRNPAEGWVRGLHKTNSGYQLGHMHQNRIPKIKKINAIKAINSIIIPVPFKDFEDLFDWVYSTLKNNGVIGVPSLWVYDIALRIGQCMSPKVEPQKYVYLYRGAHKGAKALNNSLAHKIKISKNRADITTFPPILQKEGSIHIENIMCIYGH